MNGKLLKNSRIKFGLKAKTFFLIIICTLLFGFTFYNWYNNRNLKFLNTRNERDLDFKISDIQQLRNSNLTGKNQVVVVIDTPIDTLHNEIKGKVIEVVCFSSSENGFTSLCEKENIEFDNLLNDYNHGTAIASIISGKYGIAPKSQIISINPYSLNEKGVLVIQPNDRINALNYVLDLINKKKYDISVVNLSWNTDFLSDENCDNQYQEESKIIKEIVSLGVVVVASTGNDKKANQIAFPACISSVLKVGSVDNGVGGTEGNQISDFSNYNKSTFFAPGRYIKVPRGFRNDKDRVNVSFGTSLSSGVVSGALVACTEKYSNYECIKKIFNEYHILIFSEF